MIQILEHTKEDLLATKVTEKLTDADYDILRPELKSKIKKHGKIRWYFEMDDFKGWEPKAFLEDLRIDVKHLDDLERIAMVGESDWEKWMTSLMKPFTSAEVRFFDSTQKNKAMDWIKA